MTSYGYFDDAQNEYVITNPKTPVKWVNYVGTLPFGGLVDHTGGVLICRGDPALNRITKYIPQLPSSEFKGSTLYIRLKTAGGTRVFSPFFVPTLDAYNRYECHVGMGYSRFVTEFYGVRADVTVFVPRGESRLIWDIRLSNAGDQPIELDAVPVVEYTHFDALKQFTNADWIPQTMQSRAVTQDGGVVVLLQYPFMNKERQINFFTSNQPVSSFESDRRLFLGDNEYGTWANPLSLSQPELSNTQALRGDTIGALLHHLGTVAPGESHRLIVQLGQAFSLEDAQPGIDRYRDEHAVDVAFEALVGYWTRYLETVQVDTPDASMNSMLNVFNPRQCHTTKNWSRYLSLYQLGLGARGIGFRDSSQDVMGILAHMPDEGKALIVQLLHTQTRDGYAMHQFNPLSMQANVGEAAEEGRLPYYSDDHLWIILAICAYLKETGDFAFLDEVVPYYDKDKHGQPIDSGTVLDHMRRSIAFTRENTGAHGLPLLGFADWNDTVNLLPGAESLFTANLYGRALNDLIALMAFRGDTAAVEQFTAFYEEMRARVNEQAWDGAWYVRYFDPAGEPVGSRRNSTGQIFTNGQSWPVISGFATPERALQALDAVRERLNTRNGIKLSTPGYDGYDPAIGGVSTYPPGAKENGGIFLHANPWVIIAETMVGRGERAFEYYNQINPAARNDELDTFECEPYVYPQNILGDEHPQFGLARNSWLSGTASWMYQAATQYILGVQPEYEGLRIEPCVPPAWDGFSMTRQFRGARYAITVRNPHHVSKGVTSIQVDGAALDGDVIPIFTDGATHRVEVVMG